MALLLQLTDDEMKAIIDPALKQIPNPLQILTEAMATLPLNKLQPSYVKSHFSESMVLVESSTYAKFGVYQKNAARLVTDSFISKYSAQMNGAALPDNRQFIQSILQTFMPLAVSFEKRTSNMRKSRAGTTFEYIVVQMLEKSGVKCERTAKSPLKKLNRMDIVIPNKETAMKSPDKAVFLSCKHTLRERWKQAIPDKNRNWVMYLVTLDDNLPDKKAKEINEQGMVVYVRDELKAQSHLAKKDWIRRLSDLPKDVS